MCLIYTEKSQTDYRERLHTDSFAYKIIINGFGSEFKKKHLSTKD